MCKQPAFDSGFAIAGRVHESAKAIACNDAMAWNDQRDLVVSASTADSACRSVETPCDFAVSQRPSRRNRAHHLPYAPSKLTAFNSQRKVKTKSRIRQIRFDLRDYLASKVIDWFGRRYLKRQIVHASERIPLSADTQYSERRSKQGIVVAALRAC